MPAVTLTAAVFEQTKYIISTSLGMVDPEIIAVNPNGRTFSTHVQREHTLVMTNQSVASSSVHSKTTSYEKNDASYSDLHTVIVDIEC